MKKYLFMLLFVSTALFAQKRSITFDDFFSMKRMGHVAVSPDGKKVAFDLKIPNIESNSFKTEKQAAVFNAL